jgi:hypothetical protein
VKVIVSIKRMGCNLWGGKKGTSFTGDGASLIKNLKGVVKGIFKGEAFLGGWVWEK